MLRKFKEFCSPLFKRKIESFLDAADKNNQFIIRKRNVVSFNPGNKIKVNEFIQSCSKCPFLQWYNNTKNLNFEVEPSVQSTETSSEDSSNDKNESDEDEEDERAIALMRDEYSV